MGQEDVPEGNFSRDPGRYMRAPAMRVQVALPLTNMALFTDRGASTTLQVAFLKTIQLVGIIRMDPWMMSKLVSRILIL